MSKILNPYLTARLENFFYQFRFLGLYIVFGFSSLILEFICRNNFLFFEFNFYLATFISVTIGVIFAFWANVKFNFKIPSHRRNRALTYFILISFISIMIQLTTMKFLSYEKYNYELRRLIISGVLFLVGYVLHKKISFKDFKKIGVAVYANGVEDFKKIYEKIGAYPDFIHVDLVDNTMNENAKEVKPQRLETLNAYWPNTQVQTHLMSSKPSIWLEQIIPYSDVIYVHAECKDNVEQIFSDIRASNKKTGLAITLDTDPSKIIDLLKISDYVLILTIPKPGFSGQKFDSRGFDLIKKINDIDFRKNFVLCVDGGVNENIVDKLNADHIVSGSCVLNSNNPKRKIMRLQTIGRYES